VNQQSLRGSPLDHRGCGWFQVLVTAPGALPFDMLQLLPRLAYGSSPELEFIDKRKLYSKRLEQYYFLFISGFSNRRTIWEAGLLPVS
jgi:hypothetical protein